MATNLTNNNKKPNLKYIYNEALLYFLSSDRKQSFLKGVQLAAKRFVIF